MMINKGFGIGAAMIAGLAVASPAAAVQVTFKNAQLSTSASVTAKVGTATSSKNGHQLVTVTKTVPVGPLVAKAFINTTLPTTGTPGVSASAEADGTVKFLSAARGIFDFTSAASIVQTQASSRKAVVSGSANAGAYSFSYAFVLADTANFYLNYALTDTNPALKYLSLVSLKGNSPYTMALHPNTSGSLSTLLTAGAYRLQIANSGLENAILRSGIGVGTTTSSGFDHFAFNLSGVPEPATWGVMIAGFGLIGGAMRRRRAIASFATA